MKTSNIAGRVGRSLVAVYLLATIGSTVAAADPSLAAARRMLQTGKYAEAEEAYQSLSDEGGVPAAVGLARCQQATGQREKAVESLTAALAKSPNSAELHAEQARLALERGSLPKAVASAEMALALDPNCVLAVWVKAEGLRLMGRLNDANTLYQQLVKIFNRGSIKDADNLRYVGLGAAQAARWNRMTDQFNFLVNEFYPDMLAADENCWQAHYDAGMLFAEKYNTADASREFNKALKINPNAAEVHVALGQIALESFEIPQALAAAERAKQVNSELLSAWLLKADVQLANFDPRMCAAVCGDALKLDSGSELTLGRLAAAYLSLDGVSKTDADTRFAKLVEKVTTRNSKAGTFFESLGDSLDHLRRWPAAAVYYQEAVKCVPQSIGPPVKLGMVLMRLGEEDRARKILDDAFKADPFNVRVNNTLKVLEVLDTYETIETEHFKLRYSPQNDRLTAQYMSDWLEDVYPQLVKQMGYAPAEKSLFEVFSKAKNTDGHGWFSARMVGLPRIHPIGACAGKIVALTSPTEAQNKFNWARVLKHEFIHVINLQQTEFNIPHWFTEALAVMNEGYPPPQTWNEILARRAADKKLFDLESINLGFIRPQSSDDWNLAYCQAELYAQYMVARFGEGAIAKMLAEYGANLTTAEAIPKALGVSVADFEQGYQEHVKKIVAALPAAAKSGEVDLAAAQKATDDNPQDAEAWARVALAQLDRKNYPDARRAVDKALAISPKQQLANYVRARLHLLAGEDQEGLALLEKALDRDNPQENLLSYLAGLKLKAEDFAGAAELYELGARREQGSVKWIKSLAAVYLKSGEKDKLEKVLTQLAELDGDDFPIRKKLAQMAHEAGDHAAASRWALEGLHFDVRDFDLHSWRADALAAQGQQGKAAIEYLACIELQPSSINVRFGLAQAYAKDQQPDKARQTLTELLKLEPNYPGATELLESLK